MRIKRDRAVEQKMHNLDFITYDGLKIPFDDNSFQTQITFPRTNDYGEAYVNLLSSYDDNVVSQYNLHESDDGKYIYITIPVLNSTFIKK